MADSPLMRVAGSLENASMGDTQVSDVQGAVGRLTYRGFDIRDLAQHATFEEVAYLLIYGQPPAVEALQGFKRELRQARAVPDPALRFLKNLPTTASPNAVVQAAIAVLETSDPLVADNSVDASRQKGARVLGALPGVVAAFQRIRSGKDVVAPDPEATHAGNFLWMATGQKPQPQVAKALDTALILHADHGFNASTLTVRVVAATQASIHSSLSAGAGALSGPLHGGANASVMALLERVGSVAGIEAEVERILGQPGGRVPGIGHRIYKTNDPRAVILRDLASAACTAVGQPHWYAMTEALWHHSETRLRAKSKGDLWPNVDLYSASLYHAMGLPRDLFTPVFALARTAGWIAHYFEAKADKLIRPEVEYTGPQNQVWPHVQ